MGYTREAAKSEPHSLHTVCAAVWARWGTAGDGRGHGGPSMALLEVRGLVKNYGRRRVVDGVSFEVTAGEVVGLLGPNGAGKTTSFRMTTGQITPQAGQVF